MLAAQGVQSVAAAAGCRVQTDGQGGRGLFQGQTGVVAQADDGLLGRGQLGQRVFHGQALHPRIDLRLDAGLLRFLQGHPVLAAAPAAQGVLPHGAGGVGFWFFDIALVQAFPEGQGALLDDILGFTPILQAAIGQAQQLRAQALEPVVEGGGWGRFFHAVTRIDPGLHNFCLSTENKKGPPGGRAFWRRGVLTRQGHFQDALLAAGLDDQVVEARR